MNNICINYLKISAKDELPEKMCLSCVSEMNQAFAFKQKCERSEKTLRSYLQQNNIKEEKTQIEIQAQVQTATIQKISTVSKKEVEKSPLERFECPPELSESHSDELIIHHGDMSECADSVEVTDTKFPGEFMEVENVQHFIDYIQSEEHVESLNDETIHMEVHQRNSDTSTTEEVVKDFIAENTLKFICNYCKSSFSCRRSLTLHMNCRKCMQSSYECDICNKIFVKKRYLIRHLQRMHRMMNDVECIDESKVDNNRKYKCDLCPKGTFFRKKSHLYGF